MLETLLYIQGVSYHIRLSPRFNPKIAIKNYKRSYDQLQQLQIAQILCQILNYNEE